MGETALKPIGKNEHSRAKLSEERPYTHGPAVLGTFTTRSPERPDPLALSCRAGFYPYNNRVKSYSDQ